MSPSEGESVKRRDDRYNPVEVVDPNTKDTWIFHVPRWYAGAWRTRGRNKTTWERVSFTIPNVPGAINGSVQKARDRARTRIPSIAIDFLAPAQNARGASGERVTIKEAIERFLAEKKHEVRVATFRGYKGGLENAILPFLQNVKARYPADVKREHVARFINGSTTPKGQPWTIATRRRFLFLFRHFLEWCVDSELAEKNVAMRFKGLKRKGKELAAFQKDRVGIALDFDQARKLLEACRSPFVIRAQCKHGTRAGAAWDLKCVPPPHLFLAVLIALRTGLRLGNVFGLRVEHLKNDCTEIDIPAAEMKNGERLAIPVHSELQPYLRQALRRIREEKGRAPAGKDHIVADIVNTRRLFDRVAKRAGLARVLDKSRNVEKKLRFHDLRHSMASWLAKRVPRVHEQALLGHSGGDVTSRYEHATIEEIRESLEKLPYLLPPASEAAAPASSQGA